MKTKNILMTLLLAVGAIAAKASGYPPELALVSQPVMVYNYNSITVYYDVENIGDYTYRGYVSLYLDPDYGYNYAEEYVKVRPGRIKRIALDIPLRRIDRRHTFTIMPYYELGDELYSFTTFEYFEPISFYWDGPRTERWIVVTVPPRIRVYHRPGSYRYYYDGFRPPMPAHGHGPGMPPPMDPMHHTYGYHHNNGGYPATHINEGTTPPAPAASSNNVAPNASVRPNGNAGSMSSSSSSGNTTAPASSSVSSSGVNRPSSNTRPSASTSSSSSVSRPSSSTNSATTRPSSNGSSSSVNRPSSGVSRPSSSTNSATTRPSGNGSSSNVNRPSSSTSRPSGTSSTRSSSSSSINRSSASTSSSARTNSNTSSTRGSSASSSSRGSASTGRR